MHIATTTTNIFIGISYLTEKFKTQNSGLEFYILPLQNLMFTSIY